MNTLAESSPTDLAIAASVFTWTGLQPGYVLTAENAGLLLAYSGGLAAAAVWVATDVGVWKRNQLRRLYTVGSDQYNEAVNTLYAELSRYFPSLQSTTSWRSYINVAERLAYADRAEGVGPSVYLPALSLSPDAWDSFVLAAQEGTHREFLAQLYGKSLHATKIAPSPAYVAADENDAVPYSASAPGVWADADEAVAEYEERRVKRTIELESDEYEESWIARSWHKDAMLSGKVCPTAGAAVDSLLAIHFGVVVKEQELPY